LKLNGFFLDTDTNKLLRADDGRWDFPTLMIEATSSLEFYNAGQRTLHKIEIVDNSGINQVLTSDQRSTPIAKGLFQKLKAQSKPIPMLPRPPPGTHTPPLNAVQGEGRVKAGLRPTTHTRPAPLLGRAGSRCGKPADARRGAAGRRAWRA
jgi:hypothetical protein